MNFERRLLKESLLDIGKITEHVRTRSLKQVRSHFQKYLQKLDKQHQSEGQRQEQGQETQQKQIKKLEEQQQKQQQLELAEAANPFQMQLEKSAKVQEQKPSETD